MVCELGEIGFDTVSRFICSSGGIMGIDEGKEEEVPQKRSLIKYFLQSHAFTRLNGVSSLLFIGIIDYTTPSPLYRLVSPTEFWST
jgi:hypothetical protein